MAYTWQSNQRLTGTTKYIPPALMPGTPGYYAHYRPGEEYGGNLVGKAFLGSLEGGVIGGVIGAGLTGGNPIGAGVGAAVGAFAGTMLHVGAWWLGERRKLMRLGLDSMFTRMYESSAYSLQSAKGITTMAAHTMRQQTLMAMHNTAYSVQSSMGQEARLLHR